MFDDLCSVTNAETATFVLSCIFIGSVFGGILSLVASGRAGCIIAPIISIGSVYLSDRWFVTPVDCGLTPEVAFYPIYALLFVPFGLALGCVIGDRLIRKHRDK